MDWKEGTTYKVQELVGFLACTPNLYVLLRFWGWTVNPSIPLVLAIFSYYYFFFLFMSCNFCFETRSGPRTATPDGS